MAAVGERRVWSSRLGLGDWVLAEHRIGKWGLMPGTAFLEMARAAVGDLGEVELRDVVFERPLRVGEGEVREVRTVVEGDRFEIVSRGDGADEVHHVSGKVARIETAGAGPVVPEEDAAGWVDRLADLERRMASAGVELGPRWRGLPRALRAGERAGWARFALPEKFRSDRFGLHPALLDAATGVARVLGEGDYLPLEYRSIVVRGPLPPEIECRFRLSGGEKAGETLVCDVSILDEAGREVVAVSGYTMRRLSDEAAQELAPKSAVVEAPVPASAGILPAEGGEVLARVLMRGLDSPQVLVSTRDFAAVAAQAHGLTAERLARLHSGAAAHPRPQVQTPFEAPRSALEERLAGLFQEMLGVDRVGIHDNFFDLGGNSLVATQLISRLREQFDVGLTLRALFESPTVAELGVLVVHAQAEQVEEEDLAAALAELRGLSPEELAERLAEERARAGA